MCISEAPLLIASEIIEFKNLITGASLSLSNRSEVLGILLASEFKSSSGIKPSITSEEDSVIEYSFANSTSNSSFFIYSIWIGFFRKRLNSENISIETLGSDLIIDSSSVSASTKTLCSLAYK